MLAVGAVMFLLAHNLLAGRVGRALTLIRTSEIAASSVGIPVQRYKVLAFTVAAAYGGVGAGCTSPRCTTSAWTRSP
ncbi:hypothetical protein ACFQYP_56755 [Nonomuraea antimicrobica]